jgi:hypothetical protein
MECLESISSATGTRGQRKSLDCTIHLLCFACHLYLHATREVVYYLTALNHWRCCADVSDFTFKLPYIYDTPLARVHANREV